MQWKSFQWLMRIGQKKSCTSCHIVLRVFSSLKKVICQVGNMNCPKMARLERPCIGDLVDQPDELPEDSWCQLPTMWESHQRCQASEPSGDSSPPQPGSDHIHMAHRKQELPSWSFLNFWLKIICKMKKINLLIWG